MEYQTRAGSFTLLGKQSRRLSENPVDRDLRVRAGVLEDLQHAGAGDLPHLGAELLPVQNHQVLQTVGARSSQLLVVCKRKGTGFKAPQKPQAILMRLIA